MGSACGKRLAVDQEKTGGEERCCKRIWKVSLAFMDSSGSESSKAEEIVLPDIRSLTQEELDALRANAEALKKKFEQTTR